MIFLPARSAPPRVNAVDAGALCRDCTANRSPPLWFTMVRLARRDSRVLRCMRPLTPARKLTSRLTPLGRSLRASSTVTAVVPAHPAQLKRVLVRDNLPLSVLADVSARRVYRRRVEDTGCNLQPASREFACRPHLPVKFAVVFEHVFKLAHELIELYGRGLLSCLAVDKHFALGPKWFHADGVQSEHWRMLNARRVISTLVHRGAIWPAPRWQQQRALVR